MPQLGASPQDPPNQGIQSCWRSGISEKWDPTLLLSGFPSSSEDGFLMKRRFRTWTSTARKPKTIGINGKTLRFGGFTSPTSASTNERMKKKFRLRNFFRKQNRKNFFWLFFCNKILVLFDWKQKSTWRWFLDVGRRRSFETLRSSSSSSSASLSVTATPPLSRNQVGQLRATFGSGEQGVPQSYPRKQVKAGPNITQYNAKGRVHINALSRGRYPYEVLTPTSDYKTS